VSLPRFLLQRDSIEATARAESEHQRLTLILVLTFLGAALALVMMYISVPVTMKEEVYRYVIERPPLSSFFKYAAAAIVGGGAVAALISYIATEIAGSEPGVVKMAAIGFFYGVLMPYVTGFMVPVNMFFVRIMNLSDVTTNRSFSGELIDLAFGTPRFTFMHGMDGMYQGMAAGVALFVLGWVVLHRLRFRVPRAATLRSVLISLVLSSAIAFLTLFGPFGIFKSLVEWFARA